MIITTTFAQEEARSIAFDLIEKLGVQDAMAWADDYMDGLRAQVDVQGASRWQRETDALVDLGGPTKH